MEIIFVFFYLTHGDVASLLLNLFLINVFRIRFIENFKTFKFHANSTHFCVQAITTIMGMQSKNKEKLEHTGQNRAEWQEATASRQHSTCPILLCLGSRWELMPALLSSLSFVSRVLAFKATEELLLLWNARVLSEPALHEQWTWGEPVSSENLKSLLSVSYTLGVASVTSVLCSPSQSAQLRPSDSPWITSLRIDRVES